MKNHPCDDHETDEEEPEMTPESTAEQDLRLAEFRARCARMRENTERELARLAQHRADVRVQIGITSATMEQWKLEHQQMLRDSQQ
ncbi:hypothetical protein F442_13702 [Phytophthora nicotianae P10297]|uniref:Uncharacterized protein n=4 Tax=Phytophthora nicotianae TaxID=4792 RepID=V9ENS2_PHYNI|nr:hypothetical protein F443_13865 [Phytophthora nicotianae P1569]ETK80944.1 hypothetical protein L915_13508 [Phytophthora nicotianae]ETM40869.1 hypothetical protein L914_13308 [Phytophthora nicotianae]ETO69535.1 hypothetical protein F444_13899 [Phytophthora nicotianae P1976]ETP38780.1 hypothetical protein F442_13702 [Phytophthora nicotianae P10297]